MTVHVFGNTTSPSIATYGLRKSIEHAEPGVIDLVSQNFYVDDGLLSCSDAEEAIDLVHRTKRALYDGGRLRLHKFASNSRKVLDSFDQCNLTRDFKNLDLGDATLPMQRSLGLLWDTHNDMFTFLISSDSKPFTKRGVLSTINSLYDPIGFVAPVVIKGKLLLRDGLACAQKLDWDEPLPDCLSKEWNLWVSSLSELETLHIQRNYSNISFRAADKREIHIFSDASKDAISAVTYLKLYSGDSTTVSFLLGKTKVAPPGGQTIPRLELCAAVLSVELADTIKDQLGLQSVSFHFYSDSQIVLGYISNESHRFYVFVANRISRIRHSSSPSQWTYVPSNQNPADLATRSVHSADLLNSTWLKGPEFLYNEAHERFLVPTMDLDDHDVEVRPEVKCCKTQSSESIKLGCELFNYFSDWKSLVNFIALLKYVARQKANKLALPKDPKDPDFFREVERFILRVVQEDTFSRDIKAIVNQNPLPSNSSLLSLSPKVDTYGLLHVGGLLGHVQDPDVINDISRHQIILPKNSHVSTLIVRFYHHKVSHQGRHFTEGALRSAGYWVIGDKRLVSSEISKCVTCRKLRGPLAWQHMSDLPVDRLTPPPPFSFVGVDTFGPWAVVHRRTRGGSVNQKRWALLFTCLVTRAIHIEVVEEMSSSSFINALRRPIAIRGQVKQFRSDRGTNFVGSTEDLPITAEFFEKGPIGTFLTKSGIKWIFNPPHASHTGGAWGRLIGVSRKILYSLFLQHGKRGLMHEVLVTFMAEVCAIANSRPLLPVSSDPECPSILTPATLLTMKPNPDIKPFRLFNSKEMILSHWKRVQGLAEEFWYLFKAFPFSFPFA